GDTDMLVRTMDQGRSLARTLGNRRVALMRGHGAAVVGNAIREVVVASVYMEHSARLQIQATALGPIKFLSDGEVEKMSSGVLTHPLAAERAWGTWAARVGRAD
ncbi:MAG TPA: class II aldolase/adducin family protein, partial [Chloroflexota bacterium]|nr:class II aldolase/adducin family protein [Chloroflexota bacterium]